LEVVVVVVVVVAVVVVVVVVVEVAEVEAGEPEDEAVVVVEELEEVVAVELEPEEVEVEPDWEIGVVVELIALPSFEVVEFATKLVTFKGEFPTERVEEVLFEVTSDGPDIDKNKLKRILDV